MLLAIDLAFGIAPTYRIAPPYLIHTPIFMKVWFVTDPDAAYH